jgi:hypothetical protein
MEIKDVKKNLGKIVVFESDLFGGKETDYKLTACILRFHPKMGLMYQAELEDLKNANSVLITPLKNIASKKDLNNAKTETLKNEENILEYTG